MKKPPKRIPIAAAKRYGEQYVQDQVMVFSWGPDGRTHIVTWGRTKKDCLECAGGAHRVSIFLGLGDIE